MVKNSTRNASRKDASPGSRPVSSYKGSKVEGNSKVIPLTAKTPAQQLYIKALMSSPMVIAFGPSGSGKTYVPTVLAGNLYATRQINKIILTRPVVSVGKSLGALPGELKDKFSPWLAPTLSLLKEQLGSGEVDTAVKNGHIQFCPMETMRGASFNDAMILVDESQNLTVEEFAMIVTRIGENCRVVFSGDIRQTDLKNKQDCGLTKAIHLAKKYHIDCAVVEFGVDDIVRSDLTKQWVVAMYEEGIL